MLLEIAAIIIGYMLGAIPTAYIITKLRKNIDIRDVDVGNMGGASVLRQVGIWEGSLVIAIDMAKGAAAVLIAQAFGISLPWILGAGLAAILGHNYPVYIGFRGGQGVATILGIFCVITPLAVLIPFAAFGITLLLTRRKFPYRIFIATCILSPLLPLSTWLFYRSESFLYLYYSLFIIVFLLFKNRRRLKELKVLKPGANSETKNKK